MAQPSESSNRRKVTFSYSNEEAPKNNQLSKSVVLSSSGLRSLTGKSMMENNPYFPQIYADEKDLFSHSNKMTGNRYWNGEPTGSIQIAKGKDAYFPKWGP